MGKCDTQERSLLIRSPMSQDLNVLETNNPIRNRCNVKRNGHGNYKNVDAMVII
jgi:hypothetical protein